MLRDTTPLGESIRTTLRAQSLKQKDLAQLLNITESELSEYLNGKRATPNSVAIRMATKLKIPAHWVLLAATATACELEQQTADARDTEPFKAASDALKRLLKCELKAAEPPALSSHLSLADFPFPKASWLVIGGDRRESPPSSLGDLVASSASCTDFMFLFRLRLPADTTIISDKVIRIAPDRLSRLLNRNLLIVGSPTVSLACREILHEQGATFLLNVSPSAYRAEKAICDSIPEDHLFDPKALANVADHKKEHVEQLLHMFRKSGFIDPIDFKEIKGLQISPKADYGMIALAPNPWSSNHIACICAGVHGPGTAGAIEMLSEPEQFRERPWGGIVEVSVSSTAPWEKRFAMLHPEWRTNPYTPAKYVSDLTEMTKHVEARTKPHDLVEISPDMLEKVKQFCATRLLSRSRQGAAASI